MLEDFRRGKINRGKRMVTAIAQDCLNVLLIEDNPGDANLVMNMLASSRLRVFKVTHVGVARKAVQCLKDNEFHAVLLDLSLPDTYGMETIFSILEAAPEVSIVVLSGLANEKLAIQALQYGVQEYLTKGNIDASHLERSLVCSIERNRTTGRIRKQVRELERVIGKLRNS
jgi:DNA-binding response OmpR family regulator